MFAEPLSVTYNATPLSLARVSDLRGTGVSRMVGSSAFATADGEYSVIMREYTVGRDVRRFEVILERQQVDTDPFNGKVSIPNRVGFVFEVNNLKYNTSTDLPLLQQAIIDLCDTAFVNRLIIGEK